MVPFNLIWEYDILIIALTTNHDLLLYNSIIIIIIYEA